MIEIILVWRNCIRHPRVCQFYAPKSNFTYVCLEQKFNQFVTSDMNGKLRNREETFLGTCICKTWNMSKIVEIALIGIVALIASGFLTKEVITRVYQSFRRSSSPPIQTSQL